MTKQSTIRLVFVDDSSTLAIVKENALLLKKSVFGKYDYYHVVARGKNSPLHFLKDSLGIEVVNMLTHREISPEEFESEIIENIGGFDISLQLQQLFAVALVRGLNLNPKETIVSFFEDDVLFENIAQKGVTGIRKEFPDYLWLRETAMKSGKLLCAGKYCHHHGNPLVQLLRDLTGVSQILSSKHILPNTSLKMVISSNVSYKTIAEDALYEKLPSIILSILQRASILNPITSEFHKDIDVRSFNFDEGNFALRGDLLLRLPISSLGGFQAVFYKIIATLAVSNFHDYIALEPCIVHKKVAKKDPGNYLKVYSLQNLVTNETTQLRTDINALVTNDIEAYTKVFSNILGKQLVSSEVEKLFFKPTGTISLRNLEPLRAQFGLLTALINRYQRDLPQQTYFALRNLEAMNDFQLTQKKENTIEHSSKRLNTYFAYAKRWKDIVNCNWKQYIVSQVN